MDRCDRLAIAGVSAASRAQSFSKGGRVGGFIQVQWPVDFKKFNPELCPIPLSVTAIRACDIYWSQGRRQLVLHSVM